MMDLSELSFDWWHALRTELEAPYFVELQSFLARERAQHVVYPAEEDVFRSLQLTPLDQVRVLILGQDPYHDDNQAHGLSFSVRHGVKLPPSLRNIYKELNDDLGIEPAKHGCLEAWAKQGVLLLNSVLTVRAHEANSHRRHGWEQFTDRIIECVNQCPHVAFVLWGSHAEQKAAMIDPRHLTVCSAHPSPLSAYRGFFGSRPFSAINSYLTHCGQRPVDWDLSGH